MGRTNIVIIGAGLGGAMAAGALSAHSPLVIEARPDSTFQHQAVMRIRNPDVGKYLGCSLVQIQVQKAISFDGKLHDKSNISLNNMYSLKVSGELSTRSLSELGTVDRYLLSSDRIVASNVRYGCKVTKITPNRLEVDDNGESKTIEFESCISTMPMPLTLSLCGLNIGNGCEFKHRPIYTSKTVLDLKSSVHQTIYFPSHSYRIYRATLEGNVLICESVLEHDESDVLFAANAFGLDSVEIGVGTINFKEQKMGKMGDIDDNTRRLIIMELSERFNIYSLGRYAVWKPIRTDHYIDDIEQIKRLMGASSIRRKYDNKKEVAR